MRTFRSVEFRDNEGECVVVHEFMDDDEAAKLMERLIESGATDAVIYNLTPEPFNNTVPKFEPPEPTLLEEPDEGSYNVD